MAWISWGKLCAPKAQSVMGFKQQKQFNLTLLAKQGWYLHMGGDLLMYQVFKAKYFPNSDLVQASMGSSPSYAWKSILTA